MGLNKVKSNFDTPIKLTKEAIHDLQWCMKNLYTASEKVQYPGIKKLFTLIGGEHTVKECQKEDHGLTQKKTGI